MVFQTEKALGEMEGKISDSEKSDIQAKLDALKEALKGSDIDTIKAKQEELQKAFYAVSEKMYQKAAQAQQAQGAAEDAGAQNNNGGDDNVVDAEYKEV